MSNSKKILGVYNELAVDLDQFTRQAVASNESLPIEILESLKEDWGYYIKANLASNPKSTPALLKSLLNLEDANVCHSLGANPNTPEDIVFKILNHQYYYGSSVAKNPKISARCVEYLLNKIYGLTDLATNQNLTADTYAKLATLEDVELLMNLAKNRSTPPTVLATLAESKKIDVRIQVGLNPNTNASTLAYLVNKSKNQKVLEMVASNANADTATLNTLFENVEFHSSLAYNPNLELDKLSVLLQSDNKWVRGPAVRNAKTPSKIADEYVSDPEPDVRAGLASRTSDSSILNVLANDSSDSVRSRVASSSHATPEILEELSLDSEMFVLLEVCKNPKTPVKVLQKIINQEDNGIFYRSNIARNASISEEMLTKLCDSIYASDHSNREESIAELPRIPLKYFDLLSRSKNEEIRRIVAGIHISNII